MGKSVFSVGMDGNFLNAKIYENFPNSKKLIHHGIWRWDKENSKLVLHGFDRGGSYTQTAPLVEMKDGKLTVSRMTSKKGSPVPVQQTNQFIDDNSFSWKVLSITKDPVVDGAWKRAKE